MDVWFTVFTDGRSTMRVALAAVTRGGGRAEGSLWVGCTGCEGASTGPFAAVAETVGPVAGHPHAEAMEAKIHLPL